MAVDPFEHVMDTSAWHFFESLDVHIHLPKIHLPFYGDFQITKFMVLELLAAILIVIHGGAVAKMGVGHYLKSYVPHLEVPYKLNYFIVPMIVLIEALGNFIKAFVLAVRLFANMFAGHTVLAVILLFIVMAKDTAL